MRQKLIVAIVSVALGSVLTLVVKPYIDQKIEERKVPVLVREVYRPDVSGFPAELKRQVTVLPVKYTLEHKAGGSAQNLSIFVSSDGSISPSELKFARWFEDYTPKQIDKNSIRIDIPTVRPGSGVTFELLSDVNNKIQFQEVLGVGRVLGVEAYAAQVQKTDIAIKVGIGVAILAWLFLIGIVIFVFRRVRAYLHDMDIGRERPRESIRGPVLTFLVGMMVYDTVRGSLGPLTPFLPLPYFSFSAFFYAFCLYLLITRYKLLEDVLKNVVGKSTQEGNTLDETTQN